MKKILLTANSGWYFYNFRKHFLQKLAEHAYDIVLVSPEDSYTPRLRELGFRVLPIPLVSRGKTLWQEFLTILSLAKIVWQEKPDLIHNHTVKLNFYGSLIGLFTRAKVVNSITGLGHLFLTENLFTRTLRKTIIRFYSALPSERFQFIFQNSSDREIFQLAGLKNGKLVEGSGVDIERFAFRPAKSKIPKILFASRILKEKGIFELVEAIQILRSKGLLFEMLVAGRYETEEASGIPTADLQSWIDAQLFSWLGHVDEIELILAEADIVVLPSWREGLSRILMEAMSMGKACVASNVPGCRELIQSGDTGLLFPVKSVAGLTSQLECLIQSEELRLMLGFNARERIRKNFCTSVVFEKTLAIYQGEIGKW